MGFLDKIKKVFDAKKGEEIIVCFHENNKGGIAKRNLMIRHDDYVYVFADSVGFSVAAGSSQTTFPASGSFPVTSLPLCTTFT